MNKNLLRFFLLGITIYLISFSIFFFIIYNNIISDIQEHVEILVAKLKIGSFLIPPLYYAFLYLCSGFSTSTFVLNYTAVFVLAMAVTLKFYTSYSLLKDIVPQAKNDTYALIFCSSLLFLAPIFFPIEDKRMLLGRIGLTIWHNSTLIFVLPFAVWLFRESILFLQSKEVQLKQSAFIIFLGLLNILIKPSFIFIFLPSFFILGIIHYQTKQKLIAITAIVFLLGLMLLVEYYIIYEMSLTTDNSSNRNGIGLGFFKVWNRYSNNILREILISIAFPILFIYLYYQKLKNSIYFQYTILAFIIAFLIAILIHETGTRMYHGNFFWQLIIANYILFLVIGSFLWREIIEKNTLRDILKSPKLLLVLVCYLAHLGSGFLYIFKIFYSESYT
ncbi:hypothetical protein [Thermoflexibacter ruber]|uniref:EpsG family protein n=1 Tax=Thermoflexibacter ruber TaxID=1003 RepID=A0A1I2HGG2_9BACT|nr:hypothetical protein [Thermoflexibacter ruber]SFF28390.1 hypothetical protein SAMN04488541_102378 [Thermoflexibacter ruber]